MTASVQHDQAARERRLRALGGVLGVLSLCAGVAGTWALLWQEVGLMLGAHLLAAASGGGAGAIADRRRLGTQYFPWVVAFAVPLFGGACAYVLLQTMKRARTGQLAADYADYLNDAASHRESVPLLEQATEAELLPLNDVLANPVSDAEQRIAIEYLAEMETPAALEILRKAVSSSGREAYFFAMTAMTQLEDKMLAWLGELEGRIRKDGDTWTDTELMLTAAAAYVDFIYYNFATGERRAEYLQRAETLLGRVLDREEVRTSETGRALILLGRVKLAQGDPGAAATCFSRHIGMNPESNVGWLWRAEAWHALGDYGRLREDLATARNLGGIPHNMRGVVQFWLDDAEGAPEAGGRERAPAPVQGAAKGASEPVIPNLFAVDA